MLVFFFVSSYFNFKQVPMDQPEVSSDSKLSSNLSLADRLSVTSFPLHHLPFSFVQAASDLINRWLANESLSEK